MTDQWNYPPPYENPSLTTWRQTYLTGEQSLRSAGFELHRHYVASIACAPSRTSLFTGHYPSLHGVSQTDGLAKPIWDKRRWPLYPATVPTMGNYFRAAGYQTFYKGKWHVAESDIFVPGTREHLLSYNESTGVPIPSIEKKYYNRLEDFGFGEWVGPEPHGKNPHNGGSSAPCPTNSAPGTCFNGRDVVYTSEIVGLLDRLNKSASTAPWLIVGSLLGTHDITFFGDLTYQLWKIGQPVYNLSYDPSLTDVTISAAPSAIDDLTTKPSCQADYRTKYNQALQVTTDTPEYRKYYYSLALGQDRNLQLILNQLSQTGFRDNTIVVWTSDHGEFLGAHGLRQKWFTSYEEATHVPCLFKIPESLKNQAQKPASGTDVLSSHVDIIPTLLGLAGLNSESIRQTLDSTFTEARRLVGRDLSPVITGKGTLVDAPIYITIDDQVMTGSNQLNPLTRAPYLGVNQPASLQIVLSYLGSDRSLWKFARYYDNTQWWTNPDELNAKGEFNGYDLTGGLFKDRPVADNFEMYNLNTDTLELKNLYHPAHANSSTAKIALDLLVLLRAECINKRLPPSLLPWGFMNCSTF